MRQPAAFASHGHPPRGAHRAASTPRARPGPDSSPPLARLQVRFPSRPPPWGYRTPNAGFVPEGGDRRWDVTSGWPCKAPGSDAARVANCQGRADTLRPLGAPALELSIERLAIEAEGAGGQRLVATEHLEHPKDVAPLHLFEGHQLGRVLARHQDVRSAIVAHPVGQVVGPDLVERGQGHGPLDAILELAHVAGPRV